MPCEEICLVSRNSCRLHAVGGFTRRLAAEIACQVRVTETTDVSSGLSGASAVVNLVRIGGRAMRNRLAQKGWYRAWRTVEWGVSVTREGLIPMDLPRPRVAIVALARLLRTSETLLIDAAVERDHRHLFRGHTAP